MKFEGFDHLSNSNSGFKQFDALHLLQVEDAETIVKLTEEMDSTDTAFLEEAANIIKELNKALDRFELTQLLSGPYDKEGAVISITAGAGGTDAQVYFVDTKIRYELGFCFWFLFISFSLRCSYWSFIHRI